MSSVTFSSSVGGDNSVVTDDSDASTGLANGGHRTRFVPALGQVVAVAAFIVTQATNAASSASSASTSASAAALSAAKLKGTSTSSLAVGTGSKTFTTQADKQFNVGQFVLAASDAAPDTNYMFGQITSYSSTTLIVNMLSTGGSGTYADWSIYIAGARGDTGAAGNGVPGNLTVTNPASPATLTLAGGSTFITSGGYSVTVTATGTTTVTLPTSGTLAVLGANTFTGAQILSDQQISRAMLIDCGYTFLDKGNSSTTTQDLAYTGGSHQKITATGNFTITTSAWPPTGNLGEMLLELVNGGSQTITFPTISWIKPDGTTTTSISTYLAANTGRTSLQSSGTDFIILWTRDAGSTIYGKMI